MNKINLNKKVYESKQARDFLDEEFIEFLPLKRNIKEFFDIYNKKFYSILTSTHKFFIENSLNYIKEWTNPKTITIENLQLDITNINLDILSMEKFHPIFPNNIILRENSTGFLNIVTPVNFNNNNDNLVYMQSGTARFIQGNEKENIFNYLKAKHNNIKQIIINTDILNNLKEGKPIEKIEDLNDSFYTLNIYNG